MSCSETSTSSSSKARSGLLEQDHAGDDRGSAVGVQADDRAAAGFGHVGQAREQQFDGGQLQRVAVDAGGIVGVKLLVDGGGGGGCAGDGDAALDRLRAPRAGGLRGRWCVRRARGAAAPPERAGRSGCGARSCARRRRAGRRESRAVRPTPTMNSVEPPPMSMTTVGSVGAGRAGHRAEERELRLFGAGEHAGVETDSPRARARRRRRRWRRRARPR